MSLKNAIKKYFADILVEYGKFTVMEGRTWHF